MFLKRLISAVLSSCCLVTYAMAEMPSRRTTVPTGLTSSTMVRLTRICFIDYDREMAPVAEHCDPHNDERRIVGLGNLSRVRVRNEGETAVIVSDDYQGRGLGTELLRRLVQVARAEKMERVVECTMLENRPPSPCSSVWDSR